MTYEVVKAFHDLQDYKDVKGGKVYHHYDVGDTYPRQVYMADTLKLPVGVDSFEKIRRNRFLKIISGTRSV